MFKDKLQQIINFTQIENVHSTLAIYLLQQYDQATKLSIQKIVEETGVSKTSIIQFCRYLGYPSWKSLHREMQDSYLEESLQFDRIKMNASILYEQSSMDKYNTLQKEYLEECSEILTMDVIQSFIKELDRASSVIVLGAVNELYTFIELQTILGKHHKPFIFPKVTNHEGLLKQMQSIDENTLVIFCHSTLSWGGMNEYYTLNPLFDFEKLLTSKARFIFIGRETSKKHPKVKTIGIPFSFNEYFTRMALQDFIFRVAYAYVKKHS